MAEWVVEGGCKPVVQLRGVVPPLGPVHRPARRSVVDAPFLQQPRDRRLPQGLEFVVEREEDAVELILEPVPVLRAGVVVEGLLAVVDLDAVGGELEDAQRAVVEPDLVAGRVGGNM